MQCSARTVLRASRVVRPTLSARLATSATEKSGQQAAQDAFGNAVRHAQMGLKLVEEKLGSALGAYKEPIFGNAAVAKEVLKQVYVVEKLAPPSLGQVTQTYANVYSNVQNMGFWRHLVESGEWKRYAIYGVEAYGIFTIGEMIGRRNIVGYGLDETKPAHE